MDIDTALGLINLLDDRIRALEDRIMVLELKAHGKSENKPRSGNEQSRGFH